MSQPFPGRTVGTPVITKNFRHAGKFVFVLHNTNLLSSVDPAVGHFSVFSMERDGELIFTESISDVNETAADVAPYGPMGVSHFPTNGKYGASFNDNDIVVWGTMQNQGFSNQGHTRAFQLPPVFDVTFASILATARLRTVRWSAVAPPAITDDGFGLFFGASEARARGWIGQTPFDGTATWGVQLQKSTSIPALPIQNAPALSTDESLLFMSEGTPTLVGLDSATGSIVWRYAGSAAFSTSVVPSSDGRRIYVIQEDGVVSGLSPRDGSTMWSLSCNQLSSPCTPSVLAEFSLSQSDLVLYFSDTDGNVKALQLGSLSFPTAAPTEFPTGTPSTIEPSSLPSILPTLTGSTTPSVSSSPTDTPSTGPSSSPSNPGDTRSPTTMPSVAPSDLPSSAPSSAPSSIPSSAPSSAPTSSPVTPAPVTPAPVTAAPTVVPQTSPPTSSAQSMFMSSAISTIVMVTTVFVVAM